MINLLLLALTFIYASPAPDSAVAQLRARDQALLDAIGPGDRKVWEEALADNAIYVDENGIIIERAEFLKQLEPLPSGVSGTLQIATYSASVSGDLATVIHKDDEVENYHGQVLHASYLTTETWHHEAYGWKLHLIHTFAVLKDPPAVALPVEELRQYAGRYRAAPDLAYVIQWDGKQLTGGRQGGTTKPLAVEVRDVLFAPGQPRTRKIFQRDEKGKITGFVDRREGGDLVWKVD
jgi:hypothetical protein